MREIILFLGLLLSFYANAASTPPFSEAVKVGKLLFLSGQVGSPRLGEPPVPGGIKAETEQAMQNIKGILARNGSSLDQLAKCTIMLADMKEWAQMNEVYASFFPQGRYPVRSAFGTTGLAFGARVEIECMAAQPD